jgi:hypothetical protein
VRVVEKSAAGTSTVSSTSPSEWPSIVPQTLKDKIAQNFRAEISAERLSTFVCCSCSSSILVRQRIVVNNDKVNLACLRHPHTCLSGMPPDLSHFTNANLDERWMLQGILLDRRGVENETLLFCKECHSYINKGKTPPLSLANHLLLGDVPAELRDLTPLEESVIARC